jgi:hypothetical protein
MAPSHAGAAERGTASIAVLKTDPDDDADLRDQLAEAAKARSSITLVSSEALLDASNARDVSRDDYFSGSRRDALGDTFAEVLATIDANAMLLVDVISGGDRVQIVVIGPDGTEHADIRVSTDNATADIDGTVLEPALEALPASAFTPTAKAGATAHDQPSPTGDPTSPRDTPASPQEGDTESSGTGGERAQSTAPPVRAPFEFSAGTFFGRRSLRATSSVDYELTNVVPLVGVRLAVGLRLATWSDGRSRLRLGVDGAWAPYSVEFGAFDQRFDEEGRHISGRLEAIYLRALSTNLSARIAVGGDAVSDTVDPNPVFTGSRYTNARITAGAVLHPDDAFSMTLSGGFMPIITAETSGASYGESTRGLGYTAGAMVELALAEQFRLRAGYDLRLYQSAYPDPAIIDAAIQTDDVFHTGVFGISYGF